MKSRTIEIIDNHIKALEEELEWYQKKNIEWQEKCEKLENRLDTFEANWGLAKHLNFAKSDQIQELRSENVRLREQLRWHPVSEFPKRDERYSKSNISVNVLFRYKKTTKPFIVWHDGRTGHWIDPYVSKILDLNMITSDSKWCYIPDDNQGTDCTPEGE